ncbi:hypothetical protein DOTSEDRAFT_150165, partial [Dothistroma septosporum NZE10]
MSTDKVVEAACDRASIEGTATRIARPNIGSSPGFNFAAVAVDESRIYSDGDGRRRAHRSMLKQRLLHRQLGRHTREEQAICAKLRARRHPSRLHGASSYRGDDQCALIVVSVSGTWASRWSHSPKGDTERLVASPGGSRLPAYHPRVHCNSPRWYPPHFLLKNATCDDKQHRQLSSVSSELRGRTTNRPLGRAQ